jgi:hypothetical protein
MTTFISVDGQDYHTEKVAFPSDRTFRNAWRLVEAGFIEVDMPAARELHRKALRFERQAIFDQYDATAFPLTRKAVYGELTEQEKQTLADIESDAQKLRDAPSHAAIEAAETPDDLKALTLDVLTS